MSQENVAFVRAKVGYEIILPANKAWELFKTLRGEFPEESNPIINDTKEDNQYKVEISVSRSLQAKLEIILDNFFVEHHIIQNRI